LLDRASLRYRTVEVNNTDAEGRLVLADGVAFAKINLEADIILDMATLTGAQVYDRNIHAFRDRRYVIVEARYFFAQSVSTGKYHAAIMSNKQTWEKLVVQAGIESGDLAFPIPYCPELHFNEFVSVVADMKNSCAVSTDRQRKITRGEMTFLSMSVLLAGPNERAGLVRRSVYRVAIRIRYENNLDTRRYRWCCVFCKLNPRTISSSYYSPLSSEKTDFHLSHFHLISLSFFSYVVLLSFSRPLSILSPLTSIQDVHFSGKTQNLCGRA
jgi:hypothetical protein